MRLRRRTLILAPITLAGCASSANSGVHGFASGDGSYRQVEPKKRQPVPDLRGKTLEGKDLAVSDFLGRIVVLNVWGSWCAPCRHEASALVEAAKRTSGLAQFIGLNTRDLDPAPAQAFVRSFAITYPSLFDPGGALLLEFGQLPPKAIPSTLIIDSRGGLAARALGEVTTSMVVGAVTDIAAE